jgi:hypothetical protein
MKRGLPRVEFPISFTEASAQLENLIRSCGKEVPPGWTVSDLVNEVTESPVEAPAIGRYDVFDMALNGTNSEICLKTCEFIDFLLGQGVYG